MNDVIECEGCGRAPWNNCKRLSKKYKSRENNRKFDGLSNGMIIFIKIFH